MSLASSPDHFQRPEDRALRMLFPSVEEPCINSFDEFFNKELYDGGDCEDSKSQIIDHTELHDTNSPLVANTDRLMTARTLDRTKTSPQPWRKGLWCLNPRRNSQLTIPKTRKECAAPASKSSLSPSPNNHSSVQKISHAVNGDLCTTNPSNDQRIAEERGVSYFQDQSPSLLKISPDSMRTQLRTNTCLGQYDSWQQDFQNFKLELDNEHPEHEAPLNVADIDCTLTVKKSKEASTYQHKALLDVPKPMMHHQLRSTYSTTFPHPQSPTSTNIFGYPQGPATIDDIVLNSSDLFTAVNDFQSEEDQFLNPRWTTESLHSSNSSHQSRSSHESLYQAVNRDLWQGPWMAPSAERTRAHTSQHTYESFGGVMQPILQPSTQKLLHHFDTSHESCGIYSPRADEIGIAISSYPLDRHTRKDFIQPLSCSPISTYVNPLQSYPPLPPPPAGSLNQSPFNTPRRRRAQSSSRSPSPPISPTSRRSRSLKQQSPTRVESNHHRRKSIHKSGPIKDGGHEPQRNRSASRPPRTPKTPKTPNKGVGQVDFVNFTPKDAMKLLNDVAPSGSSKTRARREQEAKEKRKKLSEAALQAVRNAGGDVAVLEMAILQGHEYEEDF